MIECPFTISMGNYLSGKLGCHVAIKRYRVASWEFAGGYGILIIVVVKAGYFAMRNSQSDNGNTMVITY